VTDAEGAEASGQEEAPSHAAFDTDSEMDFPQQVGEPQAPLPTIPLPTTCPSTKVVAPSPCEQAAWGDLGQWGGGARITFLSAMDPVAAHAFAMAQCDAWLRVAEVHGAMAGAGQGSFGEAREEETASAGAAGDARRDDASWTTVIIRNLPIDYTRDMVKELLDAEGFAAKYDFVYFPVDFKTSGGLGYAFVNMTRHEDAVALRGHLSGFSKWAFKSRKVVEVAWSVPYQGLKAHIKRYQNSSVMHPDVDDIFKPAVFRHGRREEFPAPTKNIHPPRLRYHKPSAATRWVEQRTDAV